MCLFQVEVDSELGYFLPPTEKVGSGPSLQVLEETVLLGSGFPSLPDPSVMLFKGSFSESVSPQSLGL